MLPECSILGKTQIAVVDNFVWPNGVTKDPVM